MALHNTGNFGDNNRGLEVVQNTGTINAAFLSSSPARPESPPPPASTILPRPDANYVDRHDLLERIHAKAAVKKAWIALFGLGGVGKTQLAIRYAESVRERAAQTWILWIFAANAARFDESVRDIANQIRLPGRHESGVNILQLLQLWLADSRRCWTIILDNVDDAGYLLATDPQAKSFIEHIPSCNHGTVLVTTRNRDEAHKLVDEGNVIDVEPLDLQHAKTLLQKKLGPLYEEDNAIALALALDLMPLALSQAASFIKQKRSQTLKNYLTKLESSRRSRTSLLFQHATGPQLERAASASIIQTWQISFDHIFQQRRSAAELLAFMSFCDRQAIPEFLLRSGDIETTDGAEVPEDESHDRTIDADLQILDDFSFISPSTSATTWDMHRLVQDAMQWWLHDRDELEDARRRHVECLNRVLPEGEYGSWRRCEILLPHAKSAVMTTSPERDIALQQAYILFKVGSFALYQGRSQDAIRAAEEALHVDAEFSQQCSQQTEEYMTLLGQALCDAGRYKEAEEVQLAVLKYTRSRLGEDHIDVTNCLSALADTYERLGQYDEAAELMLKVLTSRKSVFGEDDLQTIMAMHRVGHLYSDLGRLNEAEELQLKVLQTTERMLREDHPYTFSAMSNLAKTYSNLKRHTEAEDLGIKVLRGYERTLGEDHPYTLTGVQNLAATCFDLGRLGEAEKLLHTALSRSQRIHGETHPFTLKVMHNLAAIFLDQGRLQEAHDLLRSCVSLRTTILGSAHPSTRSSQHLLHVVEGQLRGTDAQGSLGMKERQAIAGGVGREESAMHKTLSTRITTWKRKMKGFVK